MTYYPLQEEEEEQLQEKVDPYTLFVYGIRSPYTKESSDDCVVSLMLLIWTKIQYSGNDAIHSSIKEEMTLIGHLIISLDPCIIKKKEYKVRRSQQARCITTSRR